MKQDVIWGKHSDYNKSALLRYIGRRVSWSLGHQRPILAYLKLTQRCNLDCHYCPWHSAANDYSGELPTSKWHDIIIELFGEGVRVFVLEGGEPTLRNDLANIIEKIHSIGGRTILATNGTARNPWSYSPTVFTTSLDGPEEYHDTIRGKGSFQKTLARLESKGERAIFCITVVSKGNYKILDELCEVVSPVVTGFLFTFLYPYDEISKKTALGPSEMEEAKANILALKGKYKIINPKNYLKKGARLADSCKDSLAISVNHLGDYKRGCFVQHKEDRKCDSCELSCFQVLSAFHNFNLEVWFNFSRFMLRAI